MSRPKPKILMEYPDPKSYISEQILEADAIYAVFYDSMPINIRTISLASNKPGPRYTRVSYMNAGHALRLAEELNLTHKTSKFEVRKLTIGELVEKGD